MGLWQIGSAHYWTQTLDEWEDEREKGLKSRHLDINRIAIRPLTPASASNEKDF
jgi:hypothetical protein